MPWMAGPAMVRFGSEPSSQQLLLRRASRVLLAANLATLPFLILPYLNRILSGASTAASRTVRGHDIPPLCVRSDVRVGRWDAVSLSSAPYHPSDKWHKSCHVRDRRNFSAPWPSHAWVPDASRDGRCSFVEWDAAAFCALMGTGAEGTSNGTSKVSFVGDSTTFQHFVALSHLLGSDEARVWMEHRSRRSGQTVSVDVCHGRVRLTFLRDDTLDKIERVLEEEPRPDVVVFNTGIHYRPDEAFLQSLETALERLERWQLDCRLNTGAANRSALCLPVLRTTLPGHPGCMSYTKPSNNQSQMESIVSDSSAYRQFKDGDTFHWWDAKWQNQLAEEALSNSTLDNYDIIDAYDINLLRPDLHQSAGDCLHYCLPGPPDVLARLLLHALARQWEKGGALPWDEGT